MAFPTTGLVSYWKLDEASGTRVDSHGTNHLTPTNAPVGAAGKIGNGCDFESSSSQYLSHADPTPLGDEDFTYTLWFKRESFGTYMLIGKDHETGRSYHMPIFPGGDVRFVLGSDAGVVSTIIGDDTNWHFAVAWYDAAANTLNIQVDGATPVTATAILPPPVTTTPVAIGARTYTGSQAHFDGLIDEVGLWRRVLTAQERSDLYNGGAGLAYETEPPPLDVPTLISIAPTQGVQGSTVAVTLTGTAFVIGATTVTVSGSGVTVNTVVVASPTSLTANIVLAPTAAATARSVTVTTAGGTSSARLFTITALPVEPPEPGDLADSSLVDTALITALASDATLAAMLPDGVYFGLAPQGKTAFTLVSIDETADIGVYDLVPARRRAIEVITYLVQAVLPTKSLVEPTQAAARIDALLQDQPLTIPGYGWLSTVRIERLRPAGEPDAGEKNIRWQHAGGRYRVQVTPAV